VDAIDGHKRGVGFLSAVISSSFPLPASAGVRDISSTTTALKPLGWRTTGDANAIGWPGERCTARLDEVNY